MNHLSVMAMLIAVLWVGFALRVEHLTEQSLWFDETSTAVSLFYARLNPLIVEARALVYFLLSAPFAAIVPTDLGLRWPSVMAGTLSIAFSFRIGKRLHNDRTGLIAAALLTVSPQFIHYSREARYYSLVPLVALITLWLAMRLTSERCAVNAWFIASVVLLAGLHLLTTLWIAVLLVILAIRRQISGHGARSGVLIGAALGTAVTVIALYLLGTLGETRLAQGVTEGAVDAPHRLIVAFFTTGWGMIVPRDPKIVLLGLLLILLVAGVWRASQIDWWTLVLLGSLILLPIIGLIVLNTLYRPIFLYRYLMPSFATLILLTAVLLSHINVRWIAGGAFGVLIASAMLAYVIEPDRQREDWRGAAAYLTTHVQAGDQVYACRARAAIPLAHYLPDLRPYYLGVIPALISDYVQPPPTAVPPRSDVWVVQNYAVLCSLADYGIDTRDLPDEPTDIVTFKRIIILRYQGVEGE